MLLLGLLLILGSMLKPAAKKEETAKKKETPKSGEYGGTDPLARYKILVSAQHGESNLFWLRYNVFLALHAALIVSLVFLGSPEGLGTFPMGATAVSIFGIVTSVVWFLQAASAGGWQAYWIAKAKHLEMKHLKFDMYSDIDSFRDKLTFYQRMGIIKGSLLVPELLVAFWSFSVLSSIAPFDINNMTWQMYLLVSAIFLIFVQIYLLTVRR